MVTPFRRKHVASNAVFSKTCPGWGYLRSKSVETKTRCRQVHLLPRRVPSGSNSVVPPRKDVAGKPIYSKTCPGWVEVAFVITPLQRKRVAGNSYPWRERCCQGKRLGMESACRGWTGRDMDRLDGTVRGWTERDGTRKGGTGRRMDILSEINALGNDSTSEKKHD